MFHEACIEEWLQHSVFCPLDKQDLRPFASNQLDPDSEL